MVKLQRIPAPVLCVGAGIWTALVWRLAGMPEPGTMGRLIPLVWLVSALMSPGCRGTVRVLAPMAVFTGFSLFWRVVPWGYQIASAGSVAGVLAMGLAGAEKRFGLIRALLPPALLVIATLPFTGDEVRFSEIAGSLAGGRGDQFVHRPGDPAEGDSHHTPVYPLLLVPGIPLGPPGVRIMALIPVLLCGYLLRTLMARNGLPRPGLTAAAAVLLMPGFSLLGPAMTGWSAAAIISGFALLPGGKPGAAGTFALALLLVAIKMRFAGAAAGMVAAWYFENTRGFRSRVWIPLGLSAGLVLLLAVDRTLLNGGLFWLRYGTSDTVSLILINIFQRPGVILGTFLHMLLDVEAGLLPKAPWVLAAGAGVFALGRRSPRLFLRLALPAVFYLVVHGIWTADAWHGLPAPATRVFMPVLPLLAVSLSTVVNRRTTGVLLALSLAVSAMTAVVPESRFNMALGYDNLAGLLEIGGLSVSMLRPSPEAVLLWLILSVALALAARGGRGTGLHVLLLAGAVVSALPGRANRTEAELMPPGMAHGAMLYPENPDPILRSLWFFSRKRLLALENHHQYLLVDGGNRLTVQAAGLPGATLIIDRDTICVESRLMPIPESFSSLRAGTSIPDRPENRAMGRYTLPIDPPVLVRIPSGGAPVYIEWVEVGQ